MQRSAESWKCLNSSTNERSSRRLIGACIRCFLIFQTLLACTGCSRNRGATTGQGVILRVEVSRQETNEIFLPREGRASRSRESKFSEICQFYTYSIANSIRDREK